MKIKHILFSIMVLACLLFCGTQVQAAETNYLVLEQDYAETMELTQDLYVDLNGHTMSSVIITNGYKIYGTDSATDSYSSDNMGLFSCVDAQGNALVPESYVKSDLSGSVKRYMTVPAESGYTFHRFYLGITHIHLNTATTGVGYKAVFYADDMVKAMLDSQNAFGYSLQLDGYAPRKLYKPAEDFVSGKAVTLRVSSFDVEGYGEAPLTARVMLKLSDGTVIESAENTVTFRSVVETVNDSFQSWTDTQLMALQNMIAGRSVMQGWNVGNIWISETSDQDKIFRDADQLAVGESLSYYANLTGLVTQIDTPYDRNYGNITVTMDVGDNAIMCYRLESGAADASLIAVGDTISVRGTIKNYNGVIEFDHSCTLTQRISGGNVAKQESWDTQDILADAQALAVGEKLTYYANLTGVVTSIKTAYSATYGNITVIMDVEGVAIMCYRLISGAADASAIAVGDTISVRGIIKNYNGIIEFDAKCKLEALTVEVPETEATEPETEATEPETEATEPDAPCVTHTDADDDGSCDRCSENVTVVIDLYAVNDLHGKLADGESHPGVDELSTYLEEARQTKDNMILLSSGDMWQGAAESNLTKGAIITDWMNEMDFVSMTMGNHEYDWGEDIIVQNAQLAEFPFLAINIYDADTNEQVDYCQSSVVVETGGLQIGIIGAIGDCYSSISADRSAGVYFKTGSQLAALVKAEADRLRSEGVDLVVYSLHGDAESYDASLSDGYVDIVFEGHTHSGYAEADSYGVYHLQGGGDNKGITYASVTYNTANCGYTVTAGEYITTDAYDSMEDHPIVAQLLEKYDEQVSLAYEVLGQIPYTSSSAITSTVAQLYAQVGQTRWSEYDIVLGGGSLSTRSPYVLYEGQVTYGDLMNILPFDNRLALCSIPGQTLLDQFINNTKYTIGYTDYGESIKDSIVATETYYVIADTWSAYYALNKLTIIEFYDDGVYARDLLADYIRQGGLS